MNKNIKKAINVYTAATLAQQAIAFGIKFALSGHKDAEIQVGEYTVKVKTSPKDMGMNMVAQTNHIMGNVAHVTVDGLFWTLPMGIQNCVLAHELGHMVLPGGMPEDVGKYALNRIIGICPVEEKIADSYSVKLYGVKATKRMLRRLALIVPSVEVIQRLMAIK